MNVDSKIEYVPGDPVLIKNIVSQLKSQGVFDQFRKECISDVDTKPAYQNLCHRVDGHVESYLSKVKWGPDLNKNQLRESIRKYVNECHFVEPGIARIVDQLVNPRINTVLVPKVEDIVYSYLGIERPTAEVFNNARSSYDARLTDKTNPYWNKDDSEKVHANGSAGKKSKKLNSAGKYTEDFKLKSPPSQAGESNLSADQSRGAHGADGLITSSSIKKASADENGCEFESIKDEPESSIPSATSHRNILKQETLDACSNIDSDEDDMSPPFEPHVKSDVDSGGDSDFSLDICPDEGDNAKPEGTAPHIAETDNETEKLYRTLERICGEESMDSVGSSYSRHVATEKSRKLSASMDIPKTPTIHYETSDDSEDNFKKSNSDGSRRESVDPSEVDVPDTSDFDLLTQKIVEDNREVPVILGKVVTDHSAAVDPNSAEKGPNKDKEQKEKDQIKEEDHGKEKEQSKEKEREDKEHSKHKKSGDSKSGDSSDKHRDRKHSDRGKEKERSKSGRQDSRNDKNRQGRDKDRSNQDRGSAKEDQKVGARTEPEKKDVSSDRKSQKSHGDDKKSKDRDSKKESGKLSSSSDRHKSSRSKSDDFKDDRKKRSSSKKETDKEKSRTGSSSSDKSKSKKEESSDVKKSKSQCNTDEKRVRTDRRSSDRDSNGPSSSSHHSTHRSSSKGNKEKHADKPRHSSSSHKNKKNSEADSSRTEDKISVAMNVADGVSNKAQAVDEDIKNNVEPTNTEIAPPSVEKQLTRINNGGTSQSVVPAEQVVDHERTVSAEGNEPDADEAKQPKHDAAKERKLSESCVPSPRSDSDKASPVAKSKSFDLSDSNIKKPKIAKNASDIFRIMELRKQYKEQMRLMQQQGKENANSGKDVLPLDCEEKTALGKLSPVNAIALKESVDNYIDKTFGKNGTVVGRGEHVANSIIETATDVKLRIRRVDSCYELVNGSCVVNEIGGGDKVPTEADSLVSNNNNNSSMSNNNISGEISECEEQKINQERTVVATEGISGNRIGNCSLDRADDVDDRNHPMSTQIDERAIVEDIKSNAAAEDAAVNKSLERVVLNVEKLIGNYVNVTEPNVDVLSDGLECDSVRKNAETSTPVVKQCYSPADIRYFDPPELKSSFVSFVAKRIKEYEELYLQNFSVHLKCPERHDNTFRSQLGAVVRRKGKADLLPSPVKYNSEIISSKSGDEKGIMLRIKKTFELDLSPLSKPSCKRQKVDSVAEDDVTPLSSDANSNCSGEMPVLADNGAIGTPSSISTGDVSISKSEKTKKVSGTTAKRKTLGIKRKILNVSKLSIGEKSKQDVLSNQTNDQLTPKMMKFNNMNHDLEEVDSVDMLTPRAANKRNEIGNSPQRNNGSLFHLSTSGDQKIDDATTNTAGTNSPATPAVITPKNQRRVSVQKPTSDQGSKEAVSKRKQFYYDEGDLYKPRPTFLSSRRSRPFNSETAN